jgi:protein phosphatase
MRYQAITKQGNRHQNEDNYLAEEIDDFFIFSIADGLGGYENGNLASKLVLETLKKNLLSNHFAHPIEDIKKTNQTILKKSSKINTMMGSTLALCIFNIDTDVVTICHIGDSRIYLINKSFFWRTKDHTLVQELVDLGIISEKEVIKHPEKHRIRQSIGISEKMRIDCYETLLRKSKILLSSDGLHDYVDDKLIQQIVKNYTPKKACEKLLERAEKNGSKDDITIIIADPNF